MKKIQISISLPRYFLKKCLGLGLILAMLGIVAGPLAQVAQASAITSASNTMSRSAVSVLSNHNIRFITPGGVAAGQTVTVTFPAGFALGTFAVTNVDFAATAGGGTCAAAFTERTLGPTPSGTTWGVAQAGQAITITSGTDTVLANSCIRIMIGTNAIFGGGGANHITNPGTPGSYPIAIAGTFNNTGNITVQILTNEQVLVSATVPQSLTFTISHNSIGFGTLDVANSRFANNAGTGSTTDTTDAHTITVGTNAANGYTMTVNGTTLSFGAHLITAIGATNTAPAPGTAQFGLRMLAGGTGTGTVSAPYAAGGFAFDTAAFPDEVASATAATATNIFGVRYLANIATLTPAGSYTATLTYVATANF